MNSSGWRHSPTVLMFRCLSMNVLIWKEQEKRKDENSPRWPHPPTEVDEELGQSFCLLPLGWDLGALQRLTPTFLLEEELALLTFWPKCWGDWKGNITIEMFGNVYVLCCKSLQWKGIHIAEKLLKANKSQFLKQKNLNFEIIKKLSIPKKT